MGSLTIDFSKMVNEYVVGAFSSSKHNVNNVFTSTKCTIYAQLLFKLKKFHGVLTKFKSPRNDALGSIEALYY